MIASVAQGKSEAVTALRRIMTGAGMIIGALGWHYHEYRRIHGA